MPLLQLLARLRTLPQADPGALRDHTAAALQTFEARALQSGLPADLVHRGHYALCDSLDDAVLNTPWGSTGAWAAHGMVASFHPNIRPGRLFDALKQAQGKAASMRPVLELMVLCLSLGMLGLYRDRPGGAAELEALRAAAAAPLIQPGAMQPGLADHWAGVEAPFRRRRPRLPVWVAASLALAVAGGAFLWLSLRANDAGDAMFAEMLALSPAHMPELTRAPPPPAPPPAAEPSPQDRLRARLATEMAAGLVVLVGTPTTPVLRVPDQAVFAAGSATPTPQARPLLQAIAEALKPEGGRVRVVGYADNRPVHTVLFPSSFKLSAARAEVVGAALVQVLGSAVTVAAEGRAAADPIAPNTTPEGREQNRRVEIVLEGAAP